VPDPGFVPFQLESAHPMPNADIRVDVRRGATTLAITWPVSAADAYRVWLREWLR
jgi:transposase